MSFINWVIDSLASEDVIDLYFVLSDLIDIPITEDQLAEEAHFSAQAAHEVNNAKASKIPIGKLVL